MPAVGGVLFRFDVGDVAVPLFCDGWVISSGGLSAEVQGYQRLDDVTVAGVPLG